MLHNQDASTAVHVLSGDIAPTHSAAALSKPHTGTTRGLRHDTQFGVPMREELVTVWVGMRVR